MSKGPRDKRALEMRDRVMQPKEEVPEEAKQTVLADADGLRQAAMAASNNGKRRIVGLYLPDGSKIEQSAVRAAEEAKKEQEAKKKMSADNKLAGAMKRKPKKDQDLKTKVSLGTVANSYNAHRSLRQNRAKIERRSEDEIDDDEAVRKSNIVMKKATEREKVSYNDLFNFFDVDKDDNWGSIEFAQRMTDIGFSTSVEDAANLLYFAGVRDVDRITYDDFLAMMPKLKAYRRLIEKDAMIAFSSRDDGSGYIPIKAMREVIIELLGIESADRSYVETILRKCDREKTGQITFEFFIRAIFGSPPHIPYHRDMRNASTWQRFLAALSSLCGKAPDEKAPQYYEESSDEDSDEASVATDRRDRL